MSDRRLLGLTLLAIVVIIAGVFLGIEIASPMSRPATVDGWKLSDADYRAVVEAEVFSMQRDPLWVSCEVARCFAPQVLHSDQGFLYWASRHWYLVNKAGQRVLFRPNQFQLEYLADHRDANGEDDQHVILKSRKVGFSTVIDALYYWRARRAPSQHMHLMAHKLDAADELWDRVTYAHTSMHPFLRGPVERSSRKELKFQDNRSHLRVLTAGGKGSGRGADIDGLHLSEAAHYPDLEDVLASAGEALRPGAWLDIESSPNGYERFRSEYISARSGASNRTPHFHRWFSFPENRVEPIPGTRVRPTADEEPLVAVHGLDAGQLLWRRAKIEALREKFLQEHPEDDESCFLTSGLPLFNNVLLRELLQVVEARVEALDLDHPASGPRYPQGGTMGTDNGRFQCWVVPVPGHRYIVGADVAEGLPGRAYSVAAVLDTSTDPPEQVAEWRGHVNPFEFGRQVLPAIGTWYNEARIAVERNNHGHATLAGLKEGGYPSVYKHRHYDQVAGRHVRRLGWPTDARTRPIMFSDLRECLEQGHMIVRSAGFVGECMHFQAPDQDRDADDFEEGDASRGNWRDRVFAWGIAWQVRKRGEPAVVA